MAAPAFYLSVCVLVLTTVAATLAGVAYTLYRHAAALWLAECMVGILMFALTMLVSQLATTSGGSVELGPDGIRLMWQALGSMAIVHALPRFVVSAFGASIRRASTMLLYLVLTVVFVLSIARVIVGWNGSMDSVGLGIALRLVLFTVIGLALGSMLVFQSRLPDRSLFRTVLVQTGALVVIVPFVYLEDIGLLEVTNLPHLAGQLLVASVSIASSAHAVRRLMRPKYVAEAEVSDYFVAQFGISDREREVVSCVFRGLENRAIAEQLFISPRTVERHLYNVYQKTGVGNRIQLYNMLQSDSP